MFNRRGLLGAIAGFGAAIMAKAFAAPELEPVAYDRDGKLKPLFSLTYSGKTTANIDMAEPQPKVDPVTGAVSWYRTEIVLEDSKPRPIKPGGNAALVHPFEGLAFWMISEPCAAPKTGATPAQRKKIRQWKEFYASREFAEVRARLAAKRAKRA